MTEYDQDAVKAKYLAELVGRIHAGEPVVGLPRPGNRFFDNKH